MCTIKQALKNVSNEDKEHSYHTKMLPPALAVNTLFLSYPLAPMNLLIITKVLPFVKFHIHDII